MKIHIKINEKQNRNAKSVHYINAICAKSLKKRINKILVNKG